MCTLVRHVREQHYAAFVTKRVLRTLKEDSGQMFLKNALYY